MTAPPLTLSHSHVVALEGDLDIFRREEIEQRLGSLRFVRFGIVDLSDVRLVDASFLGQLVALRKANCALGGTVYVVAPNPWIRNLLRMVRLERIVAIVASMAEAYECIHMGVHPIVAS